MKWDTFNLPFPEGTPLPCVSSKRYLALFTGTVRQMQLLSDNNERQHLRIPSMECVLFPQVVLGSYPEERFCEPAAKRIIENFQKELSSIEERIITRNASLEVPYCYLKPSEIENSVSIWLEPQRWSPPEEEDHSCLIMLINVGISIGNFASFVYPALILKSASLILPSQSKKR